MTQADLAARVGVTRQTIIAIEKGKYAPSLEVAFRIACAFGTPFEEVFHYERDEDDGDTRMQQRLERAPRHRS